MITHTHGNLLEANTEALVNTVNTVGIMGKGVALQFRQAYPENYKFYKRACGHEEVQLGHMLVFPTRRLVNPIYIINFPTKSHWKSKSRIRDIQTGLDDLIQVIKERNIASIAIPPLGCGNGGLDWSEVRPLIESAFSVLPEVQVLLFAPEGAPKAEEMRVATKRPNMTAGRAAIIGLMEQYGVPGYSLTMLEIQKLAYFLQVAGEPLRLAFDKGEYGPYAETLHHVLQHIEGHYIRGYGDRSYRASVHLLPGTTVEAKDFLEDHPDSKERLIQVAQLIEGFETPYGLELLATVHWLVQENPDVRDDPQLAVKGVQDWNERKKQTFRPQHIEIAWKRLTEQGWLDTVTV